MSTNRHESPGPTPNRTLRRRTALKTLAALGVGGGAFHRALAAAAADGEGVTVEMVRDAEWIAGIELSDEDRKTAASGLNRALHRFAELRAVDVDYDTPPALIFQVEGADKRQDGGQTSVRPIERHAPERPADDADLAFLPITELASLVRTNQVSSVELTKLYLARLRQYDPVLRCVVSYTEELALQQAERADREIAAGRYRGPLHGIPWGAKDLIAYPGYKTSWGATPFADQELDAKATVAARLEEAGAVLVAKLSLGALAQGDRWFRGRTRNPWNPRQGSSGSSAGSAAATAAGLVGFALGSETLGSIVSPCRRCGATGLRPTFGRVSRHGCMTLAWSMDKIGPITRSVEDCALVFGAIAGSDGLDATIVDRPFTWPSTRDVRNLRVGYIEQPSKPRDERAELRAFAELGVELVPIKLPADYPIRALTMILNTEAATAFDSITRAGVTEGLNTWPRAFREAQFTPAVEYLRANRIRSMLMREMEQAIDGIDVYVGGNDLALTNLTGHPSVVLPGGFVTVGSRTTPRGITFTGQLFGESELLALAHAWQQATGFHLKRPPMDQLTPDNADPPRAKDA